MAMSDFQHLADTIYDFLFENTELDDEVIEEISFRSARSIMRDVKDAEDDDYGDLY